LGESGAVEALVGRLRAKTSTAEAVAMQEALLALCSLSHANRRRLITSVDGLAAVAAALALEGAAAARAVVLLRTALAGTDADACRRLPMSALPPLVALLRDGEPAAAVAAMAVLRSLATVEEDDEHVRWHDSLRDAGCLPPLVHSLSATVPVRAAARVAPATLTERSNASSTRTHSHPRRSRWVVVNQEAVRTAAVATLAALVEGNAANQAAVCALNVVPVLEKTVAPLGWASTSRTSYQVRGASQAAGRTLPNDVKVVR